MVAIVVVCERFHRFFPILSNAFAEHFHVRSHLRFNFLLCDAANASIFRQHAEIVDVVQFAEDADLREFCDTRQKDKAQVGVGIF